MNIALITSEQCLAGQNIKKQLLHMFEFKSVGKHDGHDVHERKVGENTVSLYTIKTKHIFAENLDKEIDADLFIFATTHKSSAGVKALTVHAPGNWGKAELGGRDGELCIAAAPMIKEGLRQLNKTVSDRNLDFDVIQEATHHGPYSEKPCMFIEIGSSEEDYKNKEAGQVVAAAIMSTIKNHDNTAVPALGIGGLHHAPNFKEIQLETNIAVGHICPKYMLGDLDNMQGFSEYGP